MIDRPAGAYVETASGLAPDMKDEAMVEKNRSQKSEARSQRGDVKAQTGTTPIEGFEPLEPIDLTNPSEEKVSKPKKKEVTTNA